MKRPDYRTLQALDAVIRERGFERAAQKLCITQSAVSQRIKQLENMFGQPLLVRTVPPRPTEQGQKLLALLRQVELLEEEWLGDEQTGSTPLGRSRHRLRRPEAARCGHFVQSDRFPDVHGYAAPRVPDETSVR